MMSVQSTENNNKVFGNVGDTSIVAPIEAPLPLQKEFISINNAVVSTSTFVRGVSFEKENPVLFEKTSFPFDEIITDGMEEE